MSVLPITDVVPQSSALSLQSLVLICCSGSASLTTIRLAPLLADGRGKQGIYLTAIPETLMQIIANLIGREARDIISMNYVSEDIGQYGKGLIEWEDHIQIEILRDVNLDDTQKQQIILARKGQGQFRKNVQRLERFCRVTKVNRPEHLRASHCKPWRDCENADERLNGENGLLLTPSIDHLFDRGFISFEDNGLLLRVFAYLCGWFFFILEDWQRASQDF